MKSSVNGSVFLLVDWAPASPVEPRTDSRTPMRRVDASQVDLMRASPSVRGVLRSRPRRRLPAASLNPPPEHTRFPAFEQEECHDSGAMTARHGGRTAGLVCKPTEPAAAQAPRPRV